MLYFLVRIKNETQWKGIVMQLVTLEHAAPSLKKLERICGNSPDLKKNYIKLNNIVARTRRVLRKCAPPLTQNSIVHLVPDELETVVYNAMIPQEDQWELAVREIIKIYSAALSSNPNTDALSPDEMECQFVFTLLKIPLPNRDQLPPDFIGHYIILYERAHDYLTSELLRLLKRINSSLPLRNVAIRWKRLLEFIETARYWNILRFPEVESILTSILLLEEPFKHFRKKTPTQIQGFFDTIADITTDLEKYIRTFTLPIQKSSTDKEDENCPAMEVKSMPETKELDETPQANVLVEEEDDEQDNTEEYDEEYYENPPDENIEENQPDCDTDDELDEYIGTDTIPEEEFLDDTDLSE